jgi:hypothetical protein
MVGNGGRDLKNGSGSLVSVSLMTESKPYGH